MDSSFSVVEILTVLVHRLMRIDPTRPEWPERDRLVLSKGHAAPALYAALTQRGFFPRSDLARLRQIDSHLQGHPKPGTPGVDAPGGSLGQGLSFACGLAYAQRELHRWPSRSYAVLSDGELDEGQTWEAIMFAAHQALANLTLIVDANGLQYTGPTASVLDLEPIADRLAAFGWSVTVADGHSCAELIEAFTRADGQTPHAVVARTVKGKGVSFLENNLSWHGKVPDDTEYAAARQELTGP